MSQFKAGDWIIWQDRVIKFDANLKELKPLKNE